MAPDSIRMAIVDCLENLGKDNLDSFCHRLVNRGGDPRVRRNKVEGKRAHDIADALVNTFTEPVALQVTLELLGKIGCSQNARDLEEETKSLTSSTPTSSSSAAAASGGAAGQPEKHFIDKHRMALIDRVTNTDVILDELLENVIDQAVYNRIKAKSTNEERMREILDGPMIGSPRCKDILYGILERRERYLMEDLKKA